MTTQKLSIVIPLFNESQRIEILRKGLDEFSENQSTGFEYEIILVNDGSQDDTSEKINQIAEDLNAKPGHVQGVAINLVQNAGKGGALKAGVKESTGDWLLTMDADLAVPIEQVFTWVRSGRFDPEEKSAIHIASREMKESEVTVESYRRILGRGFNYICQFINNISVKDSQCGYKLYPGDLGRELFSELKVTGWAHDVELLSRAEDKGIPIVEQPVQWEAIEGSKINPARDAVRMFSQAFQIRGLLFKERVMLAPQRAWLIAFIAMILLYFVTILVTYTNYKPTWDEFRQQFYGDKIIKWYTSGFSNKEAIKYYDLQFYGGASEFLPALYNYLFKPNDIFVLRKIYTAILGLLSIIGVFRLTLLLTNSNRAAFLAGMLLLLNPVYYGHTYINSKDIFFACAYIWSIFYLARGLLATPSWTLANSLKLGLMTGLCMGVSVGGALAYAYTLVCFAAMALYTCLYKKVSWQSGLWRYGKVLIVSGLVSYLVMLFFWPWAQLSPVQGPLYAFKHFSSISWPGDVFYQGEFFKVDKLPRSYLPTLLFYQLSEITIVGLGIFCLYYFMSWCRSQVLLRHLMLAIVAFPIAYIIINKSPLYDNIRHLLFVLPPLCCLAAIGFDGLISKLNGYRHLSTAVFILIMISLFAPVSMIYRMHPHEYTYYNNFIGGPTKAFQKFEADYWAHSLWDSCRMLHDRMKEIDKDHFYKINASPSLTAGHFAMKTRMFTYTTDMEEADFIITTTRMNMHQSRPGYTLIENKVFGKPFSVVKDCRPNRLIKDVTTDHQRIAIAGMTMTHLDKVIATPKKLINKALISEPLPGESHQLKLVPLHNIAIYALTDNQKNADTFKNSGWKRLEKSFVPELSVIWAKKIPAGKVFSSDIAALYLMWPA